MFDWECLFQTFCIPSVQPALHAHLNVCVQTNQVLNEMLTTAQGLWMEVFL